MPRKTPDSIVGFVILLFAMVFGAGFWVGYEWDDWMFGGSRKDPKVAIYKEEELKEEKHKIAFQRTVEFAKRNHQIDEVKFDALFEQDNGEISCLVKWSSGIEGSKPLQTQLIMRYDQQLEIIDYWLFNWSQDKKTRLTPEDVNRKLKEKLKEVPRLIRNIFVRVFSGKGK